MDTRQRKQNYQNMAERLFSSFVEGGWREKGYEKQPIKMHNFVSNCPPIKINVK